MPLYKQLYSTAKSKFASLRRRYHYSMHVQYEKMYAAVCATSLPVVYIRVNGDKEGYDASSLIGLDNDGDRRRSGIVWIITEYLQGRMNIEGKETHWWWLDAPSKRLYNEASFLRLNPLKHISAADVRETKALPTLTGPGVLQQIQNPYPDHIFTNPIALPPAIITEKGRCKFLVFYAQRLSNLFQPLPSSDPLKSILDALVSEGTRLQTLNNATVITDAAIPISSFVSLLQPFLHHFNKEAPSNSTLFYNMIVVVLEKALSLLIKHPDTVFVRKITDELEKRLKKHLIGDKEFNIKSVMHVCPYAWALVWIATEYRASPVPRVKSAVMEGLEFGSTSSVVKFITEE